MEQFSRTESLLGKEAMKRLAASKIAVFGIGGVGGYAVEALARCGIGTFDLFDHDTVALSNCNRQIIATTKTVGLFKAEVMAERIRDINPDAVVNAHCCFFTAENAHEYDFSKYTYIVDAIDTVTSKIELIVKAQKAGIPVISCMGAGNKLDPTKFEIADIYKTSVCPLAKVMRKELRTRGITSLKVVYSKETPLTPQTDCDYPISAETPTLRRSTPGSVSFCPSAAGLILAGEVIREISGIQSE